MQCVQSIVGVIIQECKHVKTSAKIKKVFSLRDARHFEIFILTTLNAQVVQRVKRVLFHYDINRSLARKRGVVSLLFNLMSDEVRFFVRS